MEPSKTMLDTYMNSTDEKVSDKDLNTETHQEQTDESTDYLSEFVGEGKKFKTVEEAAKALAKKAVHGDSFIEQLKREKEELKKQYETLSTQNTTMESIIKQLGSDSLTTGKQDTPTKDSSQLTAESVQELVNNLLSQKEQENIKKQKFSTAVSILSNEFGSEEAAKAVIKKYTGDDPLRKEAVNTLLMSDPQSLVSILRLNSTTNSDSTTQDRSTETSTEFERKQGGAALTWSQCKKVRSENPNLYNSLKFQRAMNSAIAKDPNFYNK